jgi:hypothetical protein
MVFADVSGFTRLSERLARAGQEEAEQLVDVINACLTALLADAYGRGGSLVKFGGDAMLLLFYDDEHTHRACSVASAMRRTLRKVGHVRAGRATSYCGCRSGCTAASTRCSWPATRTASCSSAARPQRRFARCGGPRHAPRPRQDRGAAEDRTAAGASARVRHGADARITAHSRLASRRFGIFAALSAVNIPQRFVAGSSGTLSVDRAGCRRRRLLGLRRRPRDAISSLRGVSPATRKPHTAVHTTRRALSRARVAISRPERRVSRRAVNQASHQRRRHAGLAHRPISPYTPGVSQ